MGDPRTRITGAQQHDSCCGCELVEPQRPRTEVLGQLRLGRLGLAFVSVVAVLILVSIVGERLGLLEWAFARVPGWFAVVLVGIAGYPIFYGLIRDLRRGRVTAHAVMTLGLVAALAVREYSTAVVIVFFMRAGEYIENLTVNRSRAAIRALTEAAPDTATVRRNGQEQVIRSTEVTPGDVVIVRPGQRIPVDGVVVEGRAEVNQAAITGESVPVARQIADHVFAASVNQFGYLEVRAERVGPDSAFGRILKLVEEAQSSKAPVQRLADRFSAYFIPLVVAAAALAFVTTGKMMNSVAVLVVACSCAIAIATPMAVAAAVGAGARRGILVKGGVYLEALARVDTLLVDKTGTLTFGTPVITDKISLDGWAPDVFLRAAAAVERYSEHPLARAFVASVSASDQLPPAEGFQVVPGSGVSGRVEGRLVKVGTAEWLSVPQSAQRMAMDLQEQGKTSVFVSVDGELAGLVATADRVRPEVVAAFQRLRQLGISRIVMVTGDTERVAATLARTAGYRLRSRSSP